MKQAVLGLGSNQGDSGSILCQATACFQLLPQTRILRTSQVYQTAPWGYLDQPDFLNAVLLIETELSPSALLGACLGIETVFQRKRSFPNAPRTLDLDLIVMEDIHMVTPELILPHPRFLERAFVLVPLMDIFPEGTAFGVPFREAFDTVEKEGVKPVTMRLFNETQGRVVRREKK